MPQCANLMYFLVSAFVWGGVTNRPEDQATRCSLGPAELTGATGDSPCSLWPPAPCLPFTGPGSPGELAALCTPRALYMVPTPHLMGWGKEVGPALPAPAKPPLPVQENRDLAVGVGYVGERGG